MVKVTKNKTNSKIASVCLICPFIYQTLRIVIFFKMPSFLEKKLAVTISSFETVTRKLPFLNKKHM